MNIFTCKPRIESIASAECRQSGIATAHDLPGIIESKDCSILQIVDLCFSSWQLADVHHFKDFNSKQFQTVADWFCDSIRSEKIDANWPLCWLSYSDNGYTQDLAKCSKILDILRKRISRIVKLADTLTFDSMQPLHGLFIVATPDNTISVSRDALFYGQKRMRDDPAAPSRSYLKVEEAFSIFKSEPHPGQAVVDLGAAPGGWSYAAAKRGANVFAIDNGPLKKGASDNPRISHIQEDAFVWKPARRVDWLFCDMVEDPLKVLNLVVIWLKQRLFSNGIINFKFGYSDPLLVLKQIHEKIITPALASYCKCRHLYHDRDEITMILKV